MLAAVRAELLFALRTSVTAGIGFGACLYRVRSLQGRQSGSPVSSAFVSHFIAMDVIGVIPVDVGSRHWFT
jgi:hypothetical protein